MPVILAMCLCVSKKILPIFVIHVLFNPKNLQIILKVFNFEILILTIFKTTLTL